MGHGYREDDRPNVVRHVVIRHGDPDVEGDVTVRGSYEIGMQDQAFLGPESGLAVPDGAGGIDLYVATQWLHVDRDQMAPCLGLEPEQVRVHLAGVGGAFGGREDLSIQIHSALLALRTNRPVKMVYTREESFVGHVHRHPARDRGGAPRDAGRTARLRPDDDPGRRGRVRLELDGGDLERVGVRGRPVPRRQRADRRDRRLHHQPTVRRDARVRCGADLLRVGGADGPAGGRAGHRPGRAAASERARTGRHAADGTGADGVDAGSRGDPAGCGAAGARARGVAARPDRTPWWRGQHDPR